MKRTAYFLAAVLLSMTLASADAAVKRKEQDNRSLRPVSTVPDGLKAEGRAFLESTGRPVPMSAATDTFFNADGEEHDFEIHATDGDGLPIINKDGSFRAKRGAKTATEADTASDSEDDSMDVDEGYDLE